MFDSYIKDFYVQALNEGLLSLFFATRKDEETF